MFLISFPANFNEDEQKQSQEASKVRKCTPEGRKSEPKGAKREPIGAKGSPKGSQREPKGSPKGAEGSQKGAKSEPRVDQNAYKARCSEKVAKKGAERETRVLYGHPFLVNFPLKT